MNRWVAKTIVTLSFSAISLSGLSALAYGETLKYRRVLTANERHCLSEVLRIGEWRYSPDSHKPALLAARTVRVDLNGDSRKEYIFVMAEFSFCGTAGCSMLIAQADKNGVCREIYDGSGFEQAITVLTKRDHGYRRLYTPCEVRFDGRQYRQMREECPNAVVHR